MAIRLATRQDVAAIMALEAHYYIGNVDASARAEGFISVLHPREWFEAAVEARGVHVATGDDGSVLGFIVVTAPPAPGAPGSSAIVGAMAELARTLPFGGRPIAQQRYAFRGPVLIDRSARGQGLYAAFNEVTHTEYSQRFDVGVLFVALDNPRSMHTVTAKLGATPLATFDVGDRSYRFMAFQF